MSVIGNPISLGGGGGGGTVVITDTTDTHGGTIRTITPTGDITTITPLTVTSNNTYTAPTGYAYSPVTVNVSGGGGLVYEEGTFTPSTTTNNPTISFANSHTNAPAVIFLSNTDNSSSTSIKMWAFIDAYKLTGSGYRVSSSTIKYGFVYFSYTSSNSWGSQGVGFDYPSTNTGNSSGEYPRYWATNTGFTPNMSSYSRSFTSGLTFKWFAIWVD